MLWPTLHHSKENKMATHAQKCTLVNAACNYWAETVGDTYHDILTASEFSVLYKELTNEWLRKGHFMFDSELATLCKGLH